ncbi:MAG: 4Fe-4S dicluster domain-containing protein [Coriobacteriales bacterium]|nr:4Fe-4S dicluster domain-containing protein [Coriobacteriales bacterium]
MTQYSILTDLNRCVGCLACSAACKANNNVPIGSFWNKILRIGPNPMYDGAQSPDVELYYLPVQCQHCLNPECVKVCPTGASKKQADGTVQIDKEKCIGCQFCVMACPYGVRYLNEKEKVVEKCTLCEQQTTQGALPSCVAQCVGRARYFGDLEQGLKSFQGPGMMSVLSQTDGAYAMNISYEEASKSRVVVGEFLEDFSDSDVYTLPDVGNKPAMRFILRGKKWQG